LLAKYPDIGKKSSCRYLRFESPDLQGKDWQFVPNVETVRSKDYELSDSQNSGLFYAEHPNRDPALFNGTSTVATGVGHASYLLLPHPSPSN
jgi:uncharacterized protein